MRVTYVTESFPPDVNGVAHTAVRVAEHLLSRGHEPLVIAPEPARGVPLPDHKYRFPIVRVPSVGLPMYPGFRVGVPGSRVRAAIADHRPDVVHLHGPFVLGAGGCAAAIREHVPIVAVYATDMPAYARAYRTGPLGEAFAWHRLRKIHNAADLTLSPCTATATDLLAHGIERVAVWARGVNCVRFDPAKRSKQLHAELADGARLLVGYVGRLAAEKRVDLLAKVAALPGVRLVLVGSGPAEASIRRAIPSAVLLGQRSGEDLARIYASLDVFVHAGPLDLVRDGVTGFLVRPGDAQALADAVAALLADPDRRAAQGAAGRQMVLGRSWPVMCDQLLGHYADVLGAASSTAREAVAA